MGSGISGRWPASTLVYTIDPLGSEPAANHRRDDALDVEYVDEVLAAGGRDKHSNT